MAEVLKDRYGSKCGEIRQSGSELVAYDRYGARWAIIGTAKPTISTAPSMATGIGWPPC